MLNGFADIIEGHIESAMKRLEKIEPLLSELHNKEPVWAAQLQNSYELFKAEILLAKKDTQGVIALLEKASSYEIPGMNPPQLIVHNLPTIQDVLARAYVENGELDKAMSEYERLITFNPKSKSLRLVHPKYHYRLAKLYEQKSWTGKAIEHYQKFLELWKEADPDIPEVEEAKKRPALLEK